MKITKIMDFARSHKILAVLGVVIIELIVFQSGIFVGYHKAAFSFRMGDNYYRAFGPFREGSKMFGVKIAGDRDLLESNGVAGTIIKVTLPTFVIEGGGNVERVVRVTDDTIIRQLRESLEPEDLKDNQYVVVIGSPNSDSEIEARFIRLLPSPAEVSEATTSLKIRKSR